MTEQLPRPIAPGDIRNGMRVRATWLVGPATMSAEFVADYYSDGKVYVKDSGPHGLSYSTAATTWTLLEDAPAPELPAVWHFRNPANGAEYVIDVDGDYIMIKGDRGVDPYVLPRPPDRHPGIRLEPVAAFDPATLWRARDDGETRCGAAHVRGLGEVGLTCSRVLGHDGLHAAYPGYGHGTQPMYVWGDPR